MNSSICIQKVFIKIWPNILDPIYFGFEGRTSRFKTGNEAPTYARLLRQNIYLQSACLVVRELATKQRVPASYSDFGIGVCNRSDYTLNGGPSLYSPCVQKMILVPATNQSINHNIYHLVFVAFPLWFCLWNWSQNGFGLNT